jgi:cation transport ATPase
VYLERIGEDEVELLRWAACAELHNPHALASAVLARAAMLGIEPNPPDMSEHILGQSVKARVDDHDILLGNRRMMLEAGIDVSRYTNATKDLPQKVFAAAVKTPFSGHQPLRNFSCIGIHR